MAMSMPVSREQDSIPDAIHPADRMRFVQLALALVLFLAAGPNLIGRAQSDPRDYAITTPLVTYATDSETAIVSFTITNQGGDAPEESQVTIADNQSGRIVKSETLPALAAGEALAFSTELTLAGYPDGDVFLQVEVGIDQYELAGSSIARNNSMLFTVNAFDARQAIGGEASPTPQPTPFVRYDLWIPIFNLGVNFGTDGIQVNDSVVSTAQIVLAVVLLALILFLIWIAGLVLRLTIRRPPAFETWQAPYAINTYFDPDSTQGRRQSWQFQAQNSAILSPPVEEQVAVVKRLVDRQGAILGAWTIKAARTMQYDIYGRINRTEAIMSYGVIKALNDLIQSAPALDNQQLTKLLQPIAKRMSRAALAAIEKQNRTLPFAMEIRFDGVPGEGRIIFELYQCRDSAWRLVDSWEPALTNTGSRIPENFTYTLNGMLPGESYREFKARLPQDLTQLLGSLFYHHQVPAESDFPSARPPLPEAAGDDETDETSANDT